MPDRNPSPKGPGRPRDPHVAARDETIYRLIADGTGSRSALAATTGHNRDAVYLSCKRLQRDGRIQQALSDNGTIEWTLPTDNNPR
jgi:hypothetical protein